MLREAGRAGRRTGLETFNSFWDATRALPQAIVYGFDVLSIPFGMLRLVEAVEKGEKVFQFLLGCYSSISSSGSSSDSDFQFLLGCYLTPGTGSGGGPPTLSIPFGMLQG